MNLHVKIHQLNTSTISQLHVPNHERGYKLRDKVHDVNNNYFGRRNQNDK